MIIDGKMISKKILGQVKEKAAKLKKSHIIPCLAVIIVGDDAASRIYVNNKKKACLEVGIDSKEYCFSDDTQEQEIMSLIMALNVDPKVSGILVQLPLPDHIDKIKVSQAILPEKDVDCFNQVNIGKMFIGEADILPCTPSAIIEMLRYTDIKIEGKNCVIIGRSNIVGKPLAMLLLKYNGTVTICHSKTENLGYLCRQSDIIVSAAGFPGLVKAGMVKPDSVVIDVGINRLSNGKVIGDVDFEEVKNVAGYITPVPGGVGPVTISMLMNNTVIAAELNRQDKIC